MSISELLLTLMVALIAFGPKKIPMLAQNLGQLVRWVHRYKRELTLFWQRQLHEQVLQENNKKAEKADRDYQKESNKINPI
jgi:sec-independent protein translocase protein TatB